MGQSIFKLPAIMIDRIAAGEVVEGPFSVVKELLENSLDAGAKNITISTRAGGMEEILIEDDGSGIFPEDLPVAVERYATSKIRNLDDIDHIGTFGFRGEALAAISSVSLMEIRTGTDHTGRGSFLESRGGDVIATGEATAKKGTVISIKELFYATPARKKFLKSERTENQRILQTIQRISLAHPGVTFRYVRDGKELLNLPFRESVPGRIADLIGADKAKKFLEVDGEAGGIHLSGWISVPALHRANRDGQAQFVNGRYVEFKHLSYLVKRVYGELLPPGAHPYYYLYLTIEPGSVDVNVHPAKREVRITDESLLNSLVIRTLSLALKPTAPISVSHLPGGDRILNQNSGSDNANSELLLPVDALFDKPVAFSSDGDVKEPDGFQYEAHERDDQIGHTDSSSFESTRTPSSSSETNAGVNQAFRVLRHFGVVFGTYILAEAEDGLYIIDQHTAHERINYEKYKDRLQDLEGQRQPLLHPVIVKCDPVDLERTLDQRDLLLKNGFSVEAFGHDSYIIREAPVFVEPGSEEEVLSHLVERILDGESEVKIFEEYAALRACKASVKRNDVVSDYALGDILKDLARCKDPGRCPHGRPTMVKLSRSDLDRLFLRTGGG